MTKDLDKTDDHFIKLVGKANIPQGLEIGNNYGVRLSGTITATTESDKNDGSHAIYYKFEPVIVVVITDKGESIRAKDTRSLSQLFRARCWKTQIDLGYAYGFDQDIKRLNKIVGEE